VAGSSGVTGERWGISGKTLDGPALDGFGFPENREELPQDHGLSLTLEVGGDSE
jgi:hypothetical protein